MIRCVECGERVRPPKRAYTETRTGYHFYNTATSPEVYARAIEELARTVPFAHQRCVPRDIRKYARRPAMIAAEHP